MRFRSALVKALGLSLALSLGAQTPAVPRSSIPITDALPDDPALAKVIDPLKVEIQASFGQVIGHAPQGLFRANGPSESGLGYWIADAMRARAESLMGTPVKLGYTNSGGIRANLRPGPVTMGNIYEVMPFENELVVAEITGADLMQAVREGLMHRPGEPVSGVIASTGGTPGHPELVITWADGSAIDPKAVVKVATSDYLVSSSPAMKRSKNAINTGVSLRQILLDACAALEGRGLPLVAPADHRYLITPELLQVLRAKN